MTTALAIRLSTVGLLICLLPVSVTQADGNDFWDPTFGTQGLNADVFAIALDGDDVYVGGFFTKAGTLDVGRVAKWDGSTWSDVGGGLRRFGFHLVNAMLFHDGVLYVGGEFQGAGNTSATNIARWNGLQWLTMGALNGQVQALEVFQGDIYACGNFDRSGQTVVNGIARWDGSDWQPLGSGLQLSTSRGTGKAMDASDTYLYVGGHFTRAGHIAAIKTAKWDGAAWSTGAGVIQGSVEAILVVGTDVYVGGTFHFSGLNNIGRWNGTWDNLDGGSDLHVLALGEYGGAIFAAGSFGFMGGIDVNHVAKWDGANWSAFGSGLRGGALGAYAIAPKSSTEFWVGGVFEWAAGKPSRYVAHWHDPSVPVETKAWGNIKNIYRDQ